jgi:hypothetical protein
MQIITKPLASDIKTTLAKGSYLSLRNYNTSKTLYYRLTRQPGYGIIKLSTIWRRLTSEPWGAYICRGFISCFDAPNVINAASGRI